MPTAATAHSAAKSTPGTTHDRLIEAAARVCAARGIHGATTREIAETAGVNEVTLFRHFGNKEKLLGAMFAQRGAEQTEALSSAEPDEDDLARDLRRYAQRFDEMLFANEALIRTVIGEARRQPDNARQVIYEATQPLRQRVVAYLERAQRSGSVRDDIELPRAVDAFTGMLLAGMLRRTSVGACLEYAQDDYLETAVDLFIRGIQATQRRPVSASRKRARA